MNNAPNFVETTLDDDDEFIMADVHENTSVVECGYKNGNKLTIVLRSVFNGYPQT